MADWRTGFPFSIQDDIGRVQGSVNSVRFPDYFELNLHLERRFLFRRYRWAFRFGANNVTNRPNPDTVINNSASSRFMAFYGGQGRAYVLRLRWLGRI
jgi:hypothetical protein